MRLIDEDALIDALMTYTWRDEDERLIDDADEKRAYIKEWLPVLPTVGGWVSVKDRLPDKSGSYLVMLENVFVTHLSMNVHYWNAKDEYWRGSEAHSRIVGISHWMPLPEPPKEE